jgi:hypothetical protein
MCANWVRTRKSSSHGNLGLGEKIYSYFSETTILSPSRQRAAPCRIEYLIPFPPIGTRWKEVRTEPHANQSSAGLPRGRASKLPQHSESGQGQGQVRALSSTSPKRNSHVAR